MKNFLRFFSLLLPLLLLQFNLKAQTYVSGHIATNTTWTKVNSPYIVLDTVFVDPGLTFTIEPGVTVKFEPGKLLKLNDANFVGNGTITDSIFFTSNKPIQAIGDWNGIYFSNNNFTAAKHTLNYCSFNYANNALTSNSFYNVDSINISNCSFKNLNTGMFVSGIKKFSINRCKFINISNSAINVANGFYAIIRNCFFDNTS